MQTFKITFRSGHITKTLVRDGETLVDALNKVLQYCTVSHIISVMVLDRQPEIGFVEYLAL